jgi:hypothetical protein
MGLAGYHAHCIGALIRAGNMRRLRALRPDACLQIEIRLIGKRADAAKLSLWAADPESLDLSGMWSPRGRPDFRQICRKRHSDFHPILG